MTKSIHHNRQRFEAISDLGATTLLFRLLRRTGRDKKKRAPKFRTEAAVRRWRGVSSHERVPGPVNSLLEMTVSREFLRTRGSLVIESTVFRLPVKTLWWCKKPTGEIGRESDAVIRD